MQVLTFSLKGRPFAVPIEAVREIIELDRFTHVPTMPGLMRGVFNLRGAVVPLLDLAERFGLGSTELTRRTCVVVTEATADDGPQVLGALVDMVHEVRPLDEADIDAPPAFGSAIDPHFLRGLARHDERIVMLLAPDRVLSMTELEALADPVA